MIDTLIAAVLYTGAKLRLSALGKTPEDDEVPDSVREFYNKKGFLDKLDVPYNLQ